MLKKYVEIAMSYPGGCTFQILPTENYIENPIRVMEKRGFKAEVLTLRKKGMVKGEKVHGITVKRFSNAFSLYLYLVFNKDIKLIHSFLRPYVPSLLAGLVFNKPKIITPISYQLGSTKWVEKISVFLMKRFNKVIALTPYEYSIYLKNNFSRDKVVLLPFSVDYNFFTKPGRLNVKKIKSKYGIKDDFVILTVANFRKFKNLDVMLGAFKVFHDKVKNSKFVVVGKDMLKSDLFMEQKKQKGPSSIKEIVSSLGLEDCVILTGSLGSHKVRETHNISDIFVNCSDPEAQGIAVYEAAAFGLPLCLSNIGSFTSVFKENALYNPPRDEKKLAENYMKYYKNKSLRGRDSLALKNLMRNFDYKHVIRKFNEIFDEVLSNKR